MQGRPAYLGICPTGPPAAAHAPPPHTEPAMQPERTIAHLDLDSFFVSVERLHDSRLVGRPVLVGGTSDRGVVAACSYEARAFGIRSAMPMRMARQLCPEAVVIRGNSASYLKLSDEVTHIIRERVPLMEKTSIDEFYVDLTGMDRYFGCLKFATELRQTIQRETRLPISFGLSVNKTVSKVATDQAKPNNQLHVPNGTERPFLAPLPVNRIPMVGEKTHHTLCHLGVKHIGTLQQMPVEMLEGLLGTNGRTLWRKANGIDPTPVVAYNERKSISTERTFDRDTTDVAMLRGILTAMAENLAFQLRRAQKVTACITLKLRYSDFQTYTLQRTLPHTAADHNILPVVQELFARLYDRRLLVRLIGICFSHLAGGSHQISLFDEDESMINLYQGMDRIRQRFGDRAVMRASGLGARTIGRSNPFNGEPPLLLANRRA